MFYYDGGLKLAGSGLAVDFRRRQSCAFISHAHTDHMARHELALCTPSTGQIYQHRLGDRDTVDMPYGETTEWGGVRLTTYPAGHCLGSAMLLAEEAGRRLLYTGDFKLRPSLTAEPAELPRADVLVIESTYGDPRHRFAPRDVSAAELFNLVRDVLDRGRVPLLEAYALGKSQEVTRLLTDEGFAVAQHASIFEISRIYEACGVSLGEYSLWNGSSRPEGVLVAPPRTHRSGGGLDPTLCVRISVTGWARDEHMRRRLGLGRAVELSDHADYDELMEAIERVGPQEVYCTHGPRSFVDHVRAAGYEAFALDEVPLRRPRVQ